MLRCTLRPVRSVVLWGLRGVVAALLACDQGRGEAQRPPPATAERDAGDADAGVVDPERVQFTTADRWQIVGDLRLRPPPPGGRGSPLAVLLVHQLSSNRGEWAAFAARLSGPATGSSGARITTLAIDLRGHGESLAGPEGSTRWPSFGNDRGRWIGLEHDVAAAVHYLRQRAVTLNIVVVGSSIGGTAATLYAAREGAPVQGLALLSPGVSYRGIDLRAPLQRYLSRPTDSGLRSGFAIAFAASGDLDSADSTRALESLFNAADAGAPRFSARRFDGTDAHGVSLGAEGVHPELWTELEAWVRGFAR
jgi:pimeloyl-ACP methyl ester carboxylesterase